MEITFNIIPESTSHNYNRIQEKKPTFSQNARLIICHAFHAP